MRGALSDAEKELLASLRAVVDETPSLAHELEVFDLESERVWSELSNADSADALLSPPQATDFEFGGNLTGTLQVVALLWGTYKMLGEIWRRVEDYRHKRALAAQALRETWITHLIGAGLSPSVATEIVSTHGARAAEAIILRSLE